LGPSGRGLVLKLRLGRTADPDGLVLHRPSDRHHRRGGRGDRQPGGLLCMACALAPSDARGALRGALRVVLAPGHGAAFLALWRYKIGVISVIGACALAGLGYSISW
jgi:hypothetical protein